MLQSKLGFIGYDSPASQMAQRQDNIIGKILGELDKASNWVESTFNIPSIFRSPFRPLTSSKDKILVGASDLPRNFDAR